MEEKALSQNNIILDLESDSYKAIKVSHGLISGYSSIMFQYMLTGKPVLSTIDKERKNKKGFIAPIIWGITLIMKI